MGYGETAVRIEGPEEDQHIQSVSSKFRWLPRLFLRFTIGVSLGSVIVAILEGGGFALLVIVPVLWLGFSALSLEKYFVHPRWPAVAAALNGRIVQEKSGCWIFATDRSYVVAPVGRWLLRIRLGDEHGDPGGAYTSVSAVYESVDDFRFALESWNGWTAFKQRLGFAKHTRPVESDLAVESNDHDRAMQIILHPEFQEVVSEALLDDKLRIDDVGRLYFGSWGEIADIDRLVELHQLFRVTLEQLVIIGAANNPAEAGAILTPSE